MNHLTKRCGCGDVFALAHLKDRSSQCVACQRRDARGLNERRPGLWLEWRCANDPLVYSRSGNPDAFVAKFGELAFRLVAHRSGDWSIKSDWDQRDGVRQCGLARDLRTAQIQAERAAACMALCSYAERFKGHVRSVAARHVDGFDVIPEVKRRIGKVMCAANGPVRDVCSVECTNGQVTVLGDLPGFAKYAQILGDRVIFGTYQGWWAEGTIEWLS